MKLKRSTHFLNFPKSLELVLLTFYYQILNLEILKYLELMYINSTILLQKLLGC